jgi:hypothetical protein
MVFTAVREDLHFHPRAHGVIVKIPRPMAPLE